MEERQPSYDELKAQLAEARAEIARLTGFAQDRIKASVAGQSKPKDTVLKVLLKDNAVFADAFNHAVFKNAPIDPANLIDLDTDESAIISIAGSNLLLPFFREVVKGRIAGIETSLIGAKTICVDGRHQTLLAVPVKVFHCHCSTVHRMVKAVPRGLANHIVAEYRSDQEKCGKRGRIPHLPRNLIVYTVTFVSTRGTRMPES